VNYFVVMIELWCLLLICTVTGRRLVDLLPQAMGRTIGFYIAPILGLSALILFTTLYGWIAPFKLIYSLPLTIAIVALSFIFEKKKHELLKDSAYIGVFAFLCALPILAPIIRFSGYNPFTDIFTYLAQAQWLQEHSFAEKVITSGNYPALTQIALYQESGSRMGGSFLLGYVQSLFALKWSYYAYTATVSLGLVAGCMSLGGIIRHVIPSRRITILALSLLPSLMMNGFIYGAEWGFYPQTLGLAFALGVCAIFPYLTSILIKNNTNFIKIFTYSIPVSICTGALLFAYNEPFPIFLAAISLYLLIIACSNFSKIKTLLVYISVFFTQVILIINYEAIRIVNNIYQTLTISSGAADIGWPVLWSPIQFLAFSFGMKSPFNHKNLSFDYFYSTIFAFIIITIMAVTLIRFMRANPKRRENIVFLICIEFVLLIFFLKFRYLSISKSSLEIGHTFLQFKIAKYAAPFSISLLGIFAAIWWQNFKAHRKIFIYIYACLFVVGLWFHCKISAKNYTNHFLNSVETRHDPFNVLLQLREEVATIPSDKIIYVDLGYEQSKLRQMVAYILYDRKIASDYRDDGYIVGRLPAQDANMPKEVAYKIITMKNPEDSEDNENIIVGPFAIKPIKNQE
jgi:hypothetical protein